MLEGDAVVVPRLISLINGVPKQGQARYCEEKHFELVQTIEDCSIDILVSCLQDSNLAFNINNFIQLHRRRILIIQRRDFVSNVPSVCLRRLLLHLLKNPADVAVQRALDCAILHLDRSVDEVEKQDPVDGESYWDEEIFSEFPCFLRELTSGDCSSLRQVFLEGDIAQKAQSLMRWNLIYSVNIFSKIAVVAKVYEHIDEIVEQPARLVLEAMDYFHAAGKEAERYFYLAACLPANITKLASCSDLQGAAWGTRAAPNTRKVASAFVKNYVVPCIVNENCAKKMKVIYSCFEEMFTVRLKEDLFNHLAGLVFLGNVNEGLADDIVNLFAEEFLLSDVSRLIYSPLLSHAAFELLQGCRLHLLGKCFLQSVNKAGQLFIAMHTVLKAFIEDKTRRTLFCKVWPAGWERVWGFLNEIDEYKRYFQWDNEADILVNIKNCFKHHYDCSMHLRSKYFFRKYLKESLAQIEASDQEVDDGERLQAIRVELEKALAIYFIYSVEAIDEFFERNTGKILLIGLYEVEIRLVPIMAQVAGVVIRDSIARNSSVATELPVSAGVVPTGEATSTTDYSSSSGAFFTARSTSKEDAGSTSSCTVVG